MDGRRMWNRVREPEKLRIHWYRWKIWNLIYNFESNSRKRKKTVVKSISCKEKMEEVTVQDIM